MALHYVVVRCAHAGCRHPNRDFTGLRTLLIEIDDRHGDVRFVKDCCFNHFDVLICSVTTGVGGVINQPNIRAGMTVAVFGAGGVGLNAIQGAKLLNASRIIAVDILDHKLEFTYKFGATDVINSRSEDPAKKILKLTDGGVDFAFDTFGSAITTEQMMDSLRKGGTGVLVGLAPEGMTGGVNLVDLVRNQKTLLGSYYGSASPHETFAKLVDFYTKGRIDVDSLITRRYPLSEINEAYDALARGEDGRGVIVFD